MFESMLWLNKSSHVNGIHHVSLVLEALSIEV